MDDEPLMTCPRCGTQGRFHHADIEDNTGCAIFLFGGLIPYLLMQSRNKEMFICERCHYVFRHSTPLDKYDLLGWLLIIAAVGAVVLAIYILHG